MKAFVLKISFFLCLLGVVQMSAQSTAVKKTTAKKTCTPSKKTMKSVKTTSDVSVKTPKQDAPPPPPVNTTGGIPVMVFDKTTIDFGKIKTGERPTVTYNFTNTGAAPLDIDIVSGCDCTDLEYTRTTVQPGEKGFVTATFKSDKAEAEDHKKPLKKYVDIVLKQIHPKSGGPISASLTFFVHIID